MTQLIKLKNCLSRYELDIYHYTSSYPTLKKRRWLEWEKTWKETTMLGKDVMKSKFKNKLLQYQIKWATSTLKHQSNEPKELTASEKFNFFMNELPDNYLLMLEPIVQVKKALVDGEVFLFGPNKFYCIVYIENSRDSIIKIEKSKFWTQTFGKAGQNILSPFLSINRMGEVINTILGDMVFDYLVEYVVMAPEGYIEYENEPKKITIVDKRNVEDWLIKMIGLRDSIKYKQLKAAEKILQHCESNYYERQ